MWGMSRYKCLLSYQTGGIVECDMVSYVYFVRIIILCLYLKIHIIKLFVSKFIYFFKKKRMLEYDIHSEPKF